MTCTCSEFFDIFSFFDSTFLYRFNNLHKGIFLLGHYISTELGDQFCQKIRKLQYIAKRKGVSHLLKASQTRLM